MSIAEKLKELMKITSKRMSDNDQRSALGIADSFMRGSRNIDTPGAKFDEEGPINRDGLAATLIDLLQGVEKSEGQVALAKARAFINEPFANDPKILKWRGERAARYPKGLGLE